MRFPDWVDVAGNMDFRGPCPKEHVEQEIFFNLIRSCYEDSYGRVSIHAENEGKRTFGQAFFSKKQGMSRGAADIIIPGDPCFVIEMKRKDHTKSKWNDGQLEYLEACQKLGCIVFVGLGGNATFQRFNELLGMQYAGADIDRFFYRPLKLF